MTAAPADAEPITSSASLGQTIESKRPAFRNRVDNSFTRGGLGGLRRPGGFFWAFVTSRQQIHHGFMRSSFLQCWLRRSQSRYLRAGKLVLFITACVLLAAEAATAADPLWVSTTPLDGNRQLLMVVDQQRKVLAVYHVDTTSGTVTLRSTRALGYDLQLDDFNATDPRPSALKKMLQIGGAEQTTNQTPPGEGGVSVVPAPRAARQ